VKEKNAKMWLIELIEVRKDWIIFLGGDLRFGKLTSSCSSGIDKICSFLIKIYRARTTANEELTRKRRLQADTRYEKGLYLSVKTHTMSQNIDFRAAIAVFNIGWGCSTDQITLDERLTMETFSQSIIRTLYHRACTENQLHDGEPFDTGIVIEFDTPYLDDGFTQYHSTSSIISVVCNAIAIFLGTPLPTYTVFYTLDGFKSLLSPPLDINDNYDLHDMLSGTMENYSEQISKILDNCGRFPEICTDITDEIAKSVVTCLKNLKRTADTRIHTAFAYYFNAWHTSQLEHTCINLSILLEALFSPSGNTELSHQISFYAANFLGGTKAQKFSIYTALKRFYSIRSKIVHGAKFKHDELAVIVPITFELCAEILQKLFTDEAILLTFSKDKDREKLFNDWLF